MRNYLGQGDAINVTLGGTYATGAGIVVGDRAGVVSNAGVSGDVVPVALEGLYSLTKNAEAISQGTKVYWDNGNSRVTATVGSNKPIGWAAETTASTVTTTSVKLGAW